MSMDHDQERTALQHAMTSLELDPQPEQLDLLLRFLDELHRWNQTYNLSGIKDRSQMLSRHLLDALSLHPYLSGSRLIDVGAGAGLPGLPLAIVQPQRQFWLLDSAGKKARFMRHAVRELGLGNVSVLECRVEDYQPDQPYDVVMARAFAPLDRLLRLTAHLLTAGGQVLAMQGPNQDAVAVAEGFAPVRQVTLTVPGATGVRKLGIVAKT